MSWIISSDLGEFEPPKPKGVKCNPGCQTMNNWELDKCKSCNKDLSKRKKEMTDILENAIVFREVVRKFMFTNNFKKWYKWHPDEQWCERGMLPGHKNT